MVGRRRVSYYEKLDRTMNVTFVDPMTKSERIFREASIMIAAGGTSVAEAAFLNLPVIQLGQLGISKLLPNVLPHTDLTTLSGVITGHMNSATSGPEYEAKLEKWVAAVLDTGFEIDYEVAEWGEGMDKFWQAYWSEIRRVISPELGDYGWTN
jgi:hypothetical protein